MKNTIKLIAMACVATFMLTACSNEGAPLIGDGSNASATSTVSKPHIDATSGMQQIDEETGAPYTVFYDTFAYSGREEEELENIVVVTGYVNNNTSVDGLKASHIVVADTYGGEPVRGVKPYAFEGKQLKSITLPDSIEFIGSHAFLNCKSLESVALPAKLTSIDGNAFQNCESLKEITFPDSLEYIDSAAFAFCKSLSNVTLPDSLEYISKFTFNNCDNIQVTYKGQTYDSKHLEDLCKAVNGE